MSDPRAFLESLAHELLKGVDPKKIDDEQALGLIDTVISRGNLEGLIPLWLYKDRQVKALLGERVMTADLRRKFIYWCKDNPKMLPMDLKFDVQLLSTAFDSAIIEVLPMSVNHWQLPKTIEQLKASACAYTLRLIVGKGA